MHVPAYMRRIAPSPATIIAIGAVVLASAGSATAASIITGKQIRNGTVTSRDIENGTLRGRDLRENVRERIRAHAQPGERGMQGPRGPAGPAGRDGVAAPISVQRVEQSELVRVGDPRRVVRVTATCPTGHRVISGGFQLDNAGKVEAGVVDPFPGNVIYSDSLGDEDSWSVAVEIEAGAGEPGSRHAMVTAIALCLAPG